MLSVYLVCHFQHLDSWEVVLSKVVVTLKCLTKGEEVVWEMVTMIMISVRVVLVILIWNHWRTLAHSAAGYNLEIIRSKLIVI